MNFNVKVKTQTISTIQFTWNAIENCEVYKMEQLLKHNNWKIVYWGSRETCVVEQLEDGFCFKFRLHALKLQNGQYQILFTSAIFKGTTLADLPTTLSLHASLERCEEHVVRSYIMKKPHLINIPGPRGMTPLAVATSKGNKSIINILISAGANVDLGVPSCQRTPLHIAVFCGLTEIAKNLLIKKADKFKKDCIGLTFGHYAIDGGHIDAIKFCIENGVDIEAKDNCGWTLLLRAIVMQSGISIVKFLLEQNCNLFVCDYNKLSCFDHAKMSNQKDILDILNKFAKKRTKILNLPQTIVEQ